MRLTPKEVGTDLLPCPFCGGEAILHINNDGVPTKNAYTRQQFWVKCDELNCGVSPMAVPEKAEAVRKWNERVEQAAGQRLTQSAPATQCSSR